MKEAENSGQFSYEPIRSDSSVPNDVDDDDDENFDDANETPMKSTTDSPMVKSSISAQSPMNSSVSLKPTAISSLTRESSTNSRASSIKSTTATVGSVRQSSLSDSELDQDDDVSDASNPPSASASAKGARKKSTEENEVNTWIKHTYTHILPCTFARLLTLTALCFPSYSLDLFLTLLFSPCLGCRIRWWCHRRISQGHIRRSHVINPVCIELCIIPNNPNLLLFVTYC